MELEATSWIAAAGGTPKSPNAIECNREGQLAVLLERGAQVWVPRVGEGQATEFKWAKVVGWSEAGKNQLVAKGNGRPNNVQFASALLLPWSVSGGGLNRSYSLNEEIFSSLLSWSPGGFHRGESSFLLLGLTDGSALLLGLTDNCEVRSHECNIHRAICEVSGMYVAYELLTNAEAGIIKAASWFPHRVRLEILKPTDASSCLIMVSCSGSLLNLWVFIKPTNGGKVTLHSRHVSQVLVSQGDSITSLAVLPSLAFSGPDSLKLSNLCFEVACGLYGGGLLRVSIQPKGKDFHGATEGALGAFSFNRATLAPLQMLPCPVLGVRPLGGKFGVSKHVVVYGGDRLALANISKLSAAVDNAATQSSVSSSLQLGNTIMGVAIVQSSLTRPDNDVDMDSDKLARIIAVTLGGEACVCMVDQGIRSSITFKAPLCAFSPDKHFMGVCTDFYGLWACTVEIKTVPPPSKEQQSLPLSTLLYNRMVEITLHPSPELAPDWIEGSLANIMTSVILAPFSKHASLAPLSMAYLRAVKTQGIVPLLRQEQDRETRKTALEALAKQILEASKSVAQEVINQTTSSASTSVAMENNVAPELNLHQNLHLEVSHQLTVRLGQVVNNLLCALHAAYNSPMSDNLYKEVCAIRRQVQMLLIAESAARAIEQSNSEPAPRIVFSKPEIQSLSLMAQLLQSKSFSVALKCCNSNTVKTVNSGDLASDLTRTIISKQIELPETEFCPLCRQDAPSTFDPLEPERLSCPCNLGTVERCAGTLRAVGLTTNLSSVFHCHLCKSIGIIDKGSTTDGEFGEFGWTYWCGTAAMCLYCSQNSEPVLIASTKIP